MQQAKFETAMPASERLQTDIIIMMMMMMIIIIIIIIAATGTISKSFRKYLSSVPGKHDIMELQKTAVLGTAHTLRKVLM
jgi:heme/copper-type cytochrome/quinol oxidase subunit 2